MSNAHDRAEALEHEVDAQRAQVESRLDALQERLSPGQFLDEALRYTRSGPGADYVNSLGRSVSQNPLPVALIGVGLAWLMTRPGAVANGSGNRYLPPDLPASPDPYPLATVSTRTLRRTRHERQDDGRHHSEFLDDAGAKYRAFSDAAGNRAGHFVDESGKTFRGFVDDSGQRISEFRDEAGNLMDEAGGWASHNWQMARERASEAQHSLGNGMDRARHQAADAGREIQHQAAAAGRGVDAFLQERPLVAGALAFAAGAALAAVLPHTRQEDELLGEESDALKNRAAREAEDVYERGRDTVRKVYDEASHAAEDVYDAVKETASSAADSADADLRKPH